MVIVLLMALAVLFGALVLVFLLVGRMYEVRHKVGELNEELDQKGSDLQNLMQQLPAEPTTEESNSKENM